MVAPTFVVCTSFSTNLPWENCSARMNADHFDAGSSSSSVYCGSPSSLGNMPYWWCTKKFLFFRILTSQKVLIDVSHIFTLASKATQQKADENSKLHTPDLNCWFTPPPPKKKKKVLSISYWHVQETARTAVNLFHFIIQLKLLQSKYFRYRVSLIEYLPVTLTDLCIPCDGTASSLTKTGSPDGGIFRASIFDHCLTKLPIGKY